MSPFGWPGKSWKDDDRHGIFLQLLSVVMPEVFLPVKNHFIFFRFFLPVNLPVFLPVKTLQYM